VGGSSSSSENKSQVVKQDGEMESFPNTHTHCFSPFWQPITVVDYNGVKEKEAGSHPLPKRFE
jgi:hypothetical protein